MKMLRCLLLVAAVGVCGLGVVALANPAPGAVPVGERAPKSVTVYVTKTGKKYHRDGCRYLRQSRIQIELHEARKVYGPCSVCKPPK